MVRVTFKEPQTFLSNKDQFGCFTSDMVSCEELIERGKYTMLKFGQSFCIVFTDSILNTLTDIPGFLSYRK